MTLPSGFDVTERPAELAAAAGDPYRSPAHAGPPTLTIRWRAREGNVRLPAVLALGGGAVAAWHAALGAAGMAVVYGAYAAVAMTIEVRARTRASMQVSRDGVTCRLPLRRRLHLPARAIERIEIVHVAPNVERTERFAVHAITAGAATELMLLETRDQAEWLADRLSRHLALE